MLLGTDLIGLKRTCGCGFTRANSRTEGPNALPIPQRKIPLLPARSCSLREMMSPSSSPDSVPIRLQQKVSGSAIPLPDPHASDYSVIFIYMQDAAAKLQAYMDRERLSQTQLAKRARVSQATVWRALNGRSERRGAARRKLFAYVGISEWAAPRSPRGGRNRVVDAFDRIWDRSQAHATAVAGVIDALASLRPISKRQSRR